MNHFIEDKDATFSSEGGERRPHRERDQSAGFSRRHLTFGWFALLFYLLLGAALEMLHGFKVDFYLNVSNETRRMLWTLAHAHGTLLALINIAFALTVRTMPEFGHMARTLASKCLIAATILLPAGFFFGGMFIAGGDPGLPVLLVPIGAILLFIGVYIVARRAGTTRESDTGSGGTDTGGDRKKKRQKELSRA
jgi:hypothetical protein